MANKMKYSRDASARIRRARYHEPKDPADWQRRWSEMMGYRCVGTR